jgi:hypothetical protein
MKYLIINIAIQKAQTDDKKHIFTADKRCHNFTGYFTSEIGAKGGLGDISCQFRDLIKDVSGMTTVGKVYVL